MNIDIAYKGLKYLVAWGLFYFVIKYTLNDWPNIDIVLVAAILTLLLCVCDCIFFHNRTTNNLNQQLSESFVSDNNSINSSTQSNTNQSNTYQSNTNQSNTNQSNTYQSNIQSTNQLNSVQSSESDSDSVQSSDSTQSSIQSSDSTQSNNSVYNKNEIGIKTKDYVPFPASQPVNYNVSITQDPKYTVQDYMGSDVKLDINAFGGTSNAPIKQNVYPNPNPSLIESTGPTTGSATGSATGGSPNVILGAGKSLAIEQPKILK
jgi:hypothetical protein